MTVVAMTVLCVDFYEQQGLVCVGGNSVNFATACLDAGVRAPALVGVVGNDRYGRDILAFLDDKGLEHSHVRVLEGRTASNRILIDDRGDRYFPPGAWDGGVYQDFRLTEEDWAFALGHDLVAIPGNNLNFLEALDRKTDRNVLACDFLDSRDLALMEATVPRMDLAFVSGDDEVCGWMEGVSRTCETVVTVTLGARGSRTFHRGQSHFCEPVPVAEVRDTTGCGDAYQAAFSVRYVHTRDIVQAQEAGSQAAARVLSRFGAV